jgi:hypothetical protein
MTRRIRWSEQMVAETVDTCIDAGRPDVAMEMLTQCRVTLDAELYAILVGDVRTAMERGA